VTRSAKAPPASAAATPATTILDTTDQNALTSILLVGAPKAGAPRGHP
jgi:hypothetical protein